MAHLLSPQIEDLLNRDSTEILPVRAQFFYVKHTQIVGEPGKEMTLTSGDVVIRNFGRL